MKKIVRGHHPVCSLLWAVLLAAGCDGGTTTDGASRTPPRRNIILVISDGTGFNHVAAASLYQHGRLGTQVYESFPLRLAMSTYPFGGGYDPVRAWAEFDYVRSGSTDSAAAATAMSTGVKTAVGAIGVDSQQTGLVHAAQRAERAGMGTGVVTTVPWSHATPAGFVAHNASRHNYADIAREMVRDSATDVIMGAGHPFYDADGVPLAAPHNFDYVGGRDTWEALRTGRAGGDADGDGRPDPWHLIESRQNFQTLASGTVPARVLGTAPVALTLQQGRGGNPHGAPYAQPSTPSVPTLAEMTRGALNVLDDDTDGFFLLVECGAVDWASHAQQSGRVIEEALDCNAAVEAIVAWVETRSNWEETAVVVTGDHETGYLTARDAADASGQLSTAGAGTLPDMRWHSAGHTNSLIPLYAKGSATDLLRLYAVHTDAVRGPYLDNTAVGDWLSRILE